MIPSRLSFPDDASDQGDPAYSHTVATALHDAYAFIRAHAPARAEATLLPHLGAAMTTWQRIRLLYILALATADRQQQTQALLYVDEALDHAVRLEDLESIATLAYLGAAVQHDLQQFLAAARYYGIALDALRAQSPSAPHDADLEFDLLRGLAIEAFLSARFRAAGHYLRAARRVALPGPPADLELRAAGLEWLQAQLHRWSGQPDAALGCALAAYDVYAAHGSVIELARLRIVLTDTVLDLALPTHPSSANTRRDSLLPLAEPHLLRALAATRMAEDRAGEGLALLAYARYLISRDDSGAALAMTDTAQEIALELGDLPLLAQAHTARGMVFTARHEADAAQACFRDALESIQGSDARAYALPAKRALRYAEEMEEVDINPDFEP